MKNTQLPIFALLFSLILSVSSTALAANKLIGLDTNGIVYSIDPKSGTLTKLSEEAFTSFSLGATVNSKAKFYYVVTPSGASENALYTLDLKSNALTHIDLDRSESVRDLFFVKNALYGVFYNGNAGTLGVYKINPATGVTTLVLDMSDLNVEPLPGSISQLNGFNYLLVKPETDGTKRQLLRFKTRAGSAKLSSDIVTATNTLVTCDKLKPNAAKTNFVCLASVQSGGTDVQVDVYQLKQNGKAAFVKTLAGLVRVGSGHTMLTSDQKTYYALGYNASDANNQRLIKFTSKGVVKTDSAVATIFIGANFASEEAAKPKS